MARACPACGRPNADTAARCLYCTAPLPDVEAAAEPLPSDGIPEPARSNRYLVILFPGGEPNPARIEAFSRITGAGLYESRQHLVSQRPRLFRRLDSETEARALSEALGGVGIPHYVVEEASVLELPVSRARSMVMRERHLEIDTDGRGVSIASRDLLLVVHGEITRERHQEKLLGSLKGVSHRLTPGQRLHLFSREASIGVEVEPDTFDWGVLGAERTSSSVLNVKRFLASVSAWTGATLDRGFFEEPTVLSRSSRGDDPSHVLAGGDRGPAGSVWDNEEQFRYYSRWRYRLEKYLDRHREPV